MLLLEVLYTASVVVLGFYTYRAYVILSDTKLKTGMLFLLLGFLCEILDGFIGIFQEFGYLQYNIARIDLDDFFLIIGSILILFGMYNLRKVFIEFEVQKKAIKMFKEVFE